MENCSQEDKRNDEARITFKGQTRERKNKRNR